MFKIEIWTCTNIKLTELGCRNVLWHRLPRACCALSFQLFPFSLFGWLLIHVPWQRMKRVPLSTSVLFIYHLWFIFFFFFKVKRINLVNPSRHYKEHNAWIWECVHFDCNLPLFWAIFQLLCAARFLAKLYKPFAQHVKQLFWVLRAPLVLSSCYTANLASYLSSVI